MGKARWSALLERRRTRLLLLPLAAAVASLLYFYPFQDMFRISAGVVVLGVGLVLEPSLPPFALSLLAGAGVVALRSALGLAVGDGAAVWVENGYSLAFYVVFGGLAGLLRVNRWRERPLAAGAALLLLDAAGNLAEMLARHEPLGSGVVWAVAVTALVRSVLSAALLEGLRQQKLYLLRQEHQRRYDQLNVLIADLNAELFYLQKSADDINDVMGKSFRLYEAHKEQPAVSGPALEISRGIHEIGKDYRRILQGMRSLLEETEGRSAMRLADMVRIIRENTARLLARGGREVRFRADVPFDLEVAQYYSLFSILNNLIVNAADACGTGGEVLLTAREAGEDIRFTVRDNGGGVEPELLPYLFEPGFTTKFDAATGKPSAGIGLCHVRNLAERMGGTVTVQSQPGVGTVFTITLPRASLRRTEQGG